MVKFYDLFYNDVKLINKNVMKFGCGAHIINLAVQSGLNEMKTTIDFFGKIARKIKNSPN